MAKSVHNTIGVADTAETVSIESGSYDTVLVTNRSGAQPLYFRLDGTTAVKAADDTYVVPAVAGAAKAVGVDGSSGPVNVSIISAGTEDYSVECR